MNFTQAHNDYLDPEKHDVPKQEKPPEPHWCERCKGRGVIHVEWDWSSGLEEERVEHCSYCCGKGFFEEDEEDEI